jgi:hypothetical protein
MCDLTEQLITAYKSGQCTGGPTDASICTFTHLLNARERYFKILMNPFLNPLIKENVNESVGLLNETYNTDFTWEDVKNCGTTDFNIGNNYGLYALGYAPTPILTFLDGKILSNKNRAKIPPYIVRIINPDLFVVIIFIIIIYFAFMLVVKEPGTSWSPFRLS